MKPTEKVFVSELVIDKIRVRDYLELTKPRLTFLIIFSALVGFYMGSSHPLNIILMIHTLIGTGLVAGGSEALNQYLERNYDARMKRTRNRPLPSGRITPVHAMIFGTLLTFTGLFYLEGYVNFLTSMIALITSISYVFIYTPLKRISPLNTFIGAIPGALPPLGGWVASRGEITLGGWILFAIVFFWQFPHFFSIAWIYREDYSKAGYKMLPAVDPTGNRTSRQILLHSTLLLLICCAPTIMGLTGSYYLIGAVLLSLGYLISGIGFYRLKTTQNAWRVLVGSFIYLPLLWAIMILDKVSL